MEAPIKREMPPEESIVGLVVYPPVIYLSVFLLSFVVHVLYPISFPIPWGGRSVLFYLGVFLMFGAPLLILWAQRSVGKFRKREADGTSERTFAIGPYRFSRHPTYMGLGLLTIGFSLMLNSLPVFVGSLVAFFVVQRAIVKKEEALLYKKYGDDWAEYKSKVRPWL